MTGSFDSPWALVPQSSQLPPFSASFVNTSGHQNNVTSEERPCELCPPAKLFLAVPDFAPAEWNNPDSPRGFLLQETFPYLQIPDPDTW